MYGKISGLKSSQIKRLERLYRRSVPANQILTRELARQMASISYEIGRQVGVLVNRKGKIEEVIVGERCKIQLPDLSGHRTGAGRLKGLRLIHTHLNNEPISQDDLIELILMGLDLVACIGVNNQGIPGTITYAYILPKNKDGIGWQIETAPDTGQLEVDFLTLISSLEEELSRNISGSSMQYKDRAILVSVTEGPRWKEEESLEELKELAKTDDVQVVGKVVQRVKKIDPRFLIGKGKLSELVLMCRQMGCNLLIFNNKLTPAQVKNLADFTEMKIIDRGQLILDIFARRAKSREGKIQVELAQLRYILPRLTGKHSAMSRLAGGIGGRGPGETKLEIDRRRIRDRIARLKKELQNIRKEREQRRRLRKKNELPIISIVGYTNAGKSTLLNSLTHSNVKVENKLFATLDPTSRRLRFPEEKEVIITDTVGFIRDIPEDLLDAFAATLEELYEADLLLHVADISSPYLEDHIKTVEEILKRLNLDMIPKLLVLNKKDLLPDDQVRRIEKKLGGIAISAIDPSSLIPLLDHIKEIMWPEAFSIQVI